MKREKLFAQFQLVGIVVFFYNLKKPTLPLLPLVCNMGQTKKVESVMLASLHVNVISVHSG